MELYSDLGFLVGFNCAYLEKNVGATFCLSVLMPIALTLKIKKRKETSHFAAIFEKMEVPKRNGLTNSQKTTHLL
jgi:hypothetical protein